MQAGIEQIIDPVGDNVENYMDDIAPHAEAETEYMDILEDVLQCFAEGDTLPHVKKALEH